MTLFRIKLIRRKNIVKYFQILLVDLFFLHLKGHLLLLLLFHLYHYLRYLFLSLAFFLWSFIFLHLFVGLIHQLEILFICLLQVHHVLKDVNQHLRVLLLELECPFTYLVVDGFSLLV